MDGRKLLRYFVLYSRENEYRFILDRSIAPEHMADARITDNGSCHVAYVNGPPRVSESGRNRCNPANAAISIIGRV